MHVFGLLTSATTLAEMEDILISMAIVFSSPKSGENVEKHFLNLQYKMLNMGISENITEQTDEDLMTEEVGLLRTSMIILSLFKRKIFVISLTQRYKKNCIVTLI